MNEEMPIEYVEEQIKAREEAEANGLYDTKLTLEQEMALASAVSTLSELAKETNSSMSELLNIYSK